MHTVLHVHVYNMYHMCTHTIHTCILNRTCTTHMTYTYYICEEVCTYMYVMYSIPQQLS